MLNVLLNFFVKFFYWFAETARCSKSRAMKDVYSKLFKLVVLDEKWDPSLKDSWYSDIGTPRRKTEKGCDSDFFIPDDEFRSFTSLVEDTDFFDELLVADSKGKDSKRSNIPVYTSVAV